MSEKSLGAYRIHLCGQDDISELKTFIDQYWSTGHILSQHQGLLDWLYYDDYRDHYNFVLARLNETDEIIGILGFIPTYHYDSALGEDSVTWLSIWQVRDDVSPSGFGLQLLNFVSDYQSPVAIGAIGINEEVAQIYQRLGYDVGFLNHYYMANKSISNFELIDNFNGNHMIDAEEATDSSLTRITENTSQLSCKAEKQMFDEQIPELSVKYIKNRYIEHPFFDYQVYAISNSNICKGILAMRPVSYEGAVALRWVEYVGDPHALEGIGSELQSILQNQHAEYIDIYNSGVSRDIFNRAGLCRRDKDADIVVPDYYSPFERRNIEIQFAYKTSDERDLVIYNGHSDMDRPNSIDQEE